MAENTTRQLTEADLTEFARQLHEWTKKLPDVQQGLLHRILARASSAQTDDTEGYIIIVGGIADQNFVVQNGRASPLLARAIGMSDLSFGKRFDKSSPSLG